ncbi:hypothetical protein [Natrinema sp. 74]|uniref:hypothetical protein n=1 Tax=Natrinema sp. 74 TaxID=3384159 RepID=UPI0038D42ADB
MFGGTEAFSAVDVDRPLAVTAGDDGDAPLGLDIASSVRAGTDSQELVDLTNNTSDPFDVSLALSVPGRGTLSRTDLEIDSGAVRSVLISVDSGGQTGSDALTFEVDASNGAMDLSLERSVAVTAGPTLKQRISDETRNGNAAFSISYRVDRVPSFDRLELEVENVDAGYIGPVTYTEETTEGTVSYPPGGGGDGGAGGDTYEFRFRVYDASGEVSDLYTEVTTTATGSDPPGDDLGDETDPTLVGFSVTNDEQWTNNRFTVDYEVEPRDDFGEVTVSFDNTQSDWSDATKTNDAAPTGTVVYPAAGRHQGGINGDTYNITVDVYNQRGIPVESATVSLVAGSNETVDWP